MKEKIIEILRNDPLYAVLRDTPLEEILYTDSYLADIIEKKFYSTPEVAGWFDITDAQLRYYIKPFEHYIFDDMGFDPFDTFCEFGRSFDFSGMGLSEFTEKLWLFFKDRCDGEKLRECILSDINSLPVNIHIPDCLVKYDPMYKRLKKKYSELLQKNVRIVKLSTENKVMVIVTDKIDKITGRYKAEYFDCEE